MIVKISNKIRYFNGGMGPTRGWLPGSPITGSRPWSSLRVLTPLACPSKGVRWISGLTAESTIPPNSSFHRQLSRIETYILDFGGKYRESGNPVSQFKGGRYGEFTTIWIVTLQTFTDIHYIQLRGDKDILLTLIILGGVGRGANWAIRHKKN